MGLLWEFYDLVFVVVSSVVEVQQYQGISARSSVYFIIADQLPVYSWIPDEYTVEANRDQGARHCARCR